MENENGKPKTFEREHRELSGTARELSLEREEDLGQMADAAERETALLRLPRRDLQALAKTHGVRANLSSA